jgi:hypothetical protein
VATLHVKEGGAVHRGALLVTLAGRSQLEAAVAESHGRIAVARSRLEQVKAGVRKADVSAQSAEIARLEANLQNLRSELNRYETLRRTDDVTASDVETRRTAVVVAERSLDQARHRLDSLRDVPQGDIGVAQAQVDAAVLEEQRARREFELSQVYAPMASWSESEPGCSPPPFRSACARAGKPAFPPDLRIRSPFFQILRRKCTMAARTSLPWLRTLCAPFCQSCVPPGKRSVRRRGPSARGI